MIKVHNINAGYGNKNVLEMQELYFKKGTITSILGKNGCGKSTLLRTLAGVLPYHGSITVNNNELKEISTKEKAKIISYLPQRIVQADMTVSMLVAHGRFPWKKFPRKLTSQDLTFIKSAMKRVDIISLADKNLKEISGGELKLAYLAMLLAQDTKILLLDEPDAHLDLIHQNQLYTILNHLAYEGKTIIITSHDLLRSVNYSNMNYILNNGKLAFSGTSKDIVKNKDILENILGVSVILSTQEESLYRYILSK